MSAHGSASVPELRLEIDDRLHDCEQVEGGARQPVDAGDDDHVAGFECSQHLVQLAPVGASSADFLAKDALAAGGLEPVELGLQRLADGRDAGVSVGRLHRAISPIYYAKRNPLMGKGQEFFAKFVIYAKARYLVASASLASNQARSRLKAAWLGAMRTSLCMISCPRR